MIDMLKVELKHLLLFLFWLPFALKAQKSATEIFYFESDSSTLQLKETQRLHKFIHSLDSITINSATILGYTDDVGRKTYNDTLSTKRALFIKKVLSYFKIDTNTISVTAGRGKLPLATLKSIDEQRKNNRRVEIIFNYTPKQTTNEGSFIALENLEPGDKIVLENILFEPSRHQFLEESYPALNTLLLTLKNKPRYSIAILGHICCTPPGRDIKDFDTGEYNLSYARAKAVYEYLVRNGIDAKRLTYQGMMANFPLGKGDKSDRRVELQVTSIVNY